MSASRRTVFAGAMPAPFAALPGASAPAPQSPRDIARRVRALAEEMSTLLGVLDNGEWEVRVGPPLNGGPLYDVQPVAWRGGEAAPADLARYRDFLRYELQALGAEIGDTPADPAAPRDKSDQRTMHALFGRKRPSERAIAMMRLAGGRRAVIGR